MVKPSYQYSHEDMGGREGSGMGAVSPRSIPWLSSNAEELLCDSSSTHGTLTISPNSMLTETDLREKAQSAQNPQNLAING